MTVVCRCELTASVVNYISWPEKSSLQVVIFFEIIWKPSIIILSIWIMRSSFKWKKTLGKFLQSNSFLSNLIGVVYEFVLAAVTSDYKCSCLKRNKVCYLAVLEVKSPKWVKMWVGLCFFLGLQGRILFSASQSLGASVTPSPSALLHLQSHHVTLTQTCVSLPLVRTFQGNRQTQEVFSSQDLLVYLADAEVFSGPSGVSGRRRRSSQRIGCSEGLQGLRKLWKGPTLGWWLWGFLQDLQDETRQSKQMGAGRGDFSKRNSMGKDRCWESWYRFWEVKGQDPVVWGERERMVWEPPGEQVGGRSEGASGPRLGSWFHLKRCSMPRKGSKQRCRMIWSADQKLFLLLWSKQPARGERQE